MRSASPDAAAGTPEALAEALSIIDAFLARESAEIPSPPLTADQAKAGLDIAIPERGVGSAEALRRLREVVLATPTTGGPRFVNQLFAGREPLATAAEVITAVLNTSMYTYKAAGPQVLIERAVLERMLAKAGMSGMSGMSGKSGGDGMFTPGGSLSNLAGMIVARNEVCGLGRDDGFDGTKRVLYASVENHYSIRKNAAMIGIGRGNVRLIETDEQGRMDPGALAAAIRADRAAGWLPMMIVATSGTTVMGAFDPIDALADVAEREGLWLHVDGAFGGTALMHPEHRRLLAGIERADSLAWDAHKMMGVPLICSALLTPRADSMRKHFDESASYLFQQDFAEDHAWLNPGVRSLQCGRRNDALKLWTLWQGLGDDGFADRVSRQVALARHAAEIVRNDTRLRLTHEPAWINVCFEVVGKSTAAICEQLDRTGVLKVSHGVVHGKRIVRLVTPNPEHTFADIERMIGDVIAASETAPHSDNRAE